MLLFNTDLLLNDPFAFTVLFVAVAFALVVGISVHEYAHAAVANLHGDPTAARLGRLTLNPMAHLDRAGSVMLLIVGFGWGRPVPVNPRLLRGGRRSMAIVSAAGPASNVMLAFAFAGLFQLGLLDSAEVSRQALQSASLGAWSSIIAMFAVRLNLVLAVFNLLPIAPLDGGGILAGLAPRFALPLVAKLQKVGPVVLLVILALTFLTDIDILGVVFGPATWVANKLIG